MKSIAELMLDIARNGNTHDKDWLLSWAYENLRAAEYDRLMIAGGRGKIWTD